MDKIGQNRKIALAAERSAEQANHAAEQAADKTPVGQAISAANTALEVHGKVMGAYGEVMGATGALAEKAVVAVFSKLSFMQGLAVLPASSQLDPVLGIDVHLVIIPPSPAPVPMPHPYIAMVFNPKDFLACAIMSVVAAIPPPPADSAGGQLAATVAKMALSMMMAKMNLGASVKLGGFTPRTVTGTANKVVPHFPMGASFAPIPILKNSGHAQFGSLFLLADGEPFTGLLHLNNDCWDIGIMQLMRKKAPPEAMHLFMPTGFVMAIPSHNVIINPIPTPINPIAALTKLFNFGLAKILHGIVNKLPKGMRDGLHKAVCHVTGHPVDVVSGMLFTDEEDFSLPGVIPLSWERTWYSDSKYKGPLGHGWYHNYDMALVVDAQKNQAIYRMNDGRGVIFELPEPGKFTFDRANRLFLNRHPEDGFLYITDSDGLMYRFTDKIYKDDQSQLGSHILQSISNMNGYAIRFEYNQHGHLTKVIDSAGRILRVENDNLGRISDIIAPHPSEVNNTFVIAHYDYDEPGNMICHTDALDQRMEYEYENYLLVKETWRNGHQWYFEFDGPTTGAKCIHTWGDGDIYNHKLTYTEGCTVVENSLGYLTTYYHKNGLPYTKVDANGGEWGYRYNRFSELEWETDPIGNQQSYSYDQWGNQITRIDPNGGFSSTEYYNPKFPLLPTETLSPAGGKWEWKYDNSGNIVERISPLGAKTKYTFTDGLLTTIEQATSTKSFFGYDKYQNLWFIQTDFNGTMTEFEFDFLGNCIKVINPNGLKQKRETDKKGRLSRVADFDGNIIDLEYDEIDNITKYRDKQKEILYSYKGLWKITSRTQAGTNIAFKYDKEENLCAIINEHGISYKLELDPVGNIEREIGFDGVSRQYLRNKAGWVLQINRPELKFTKYIHDRSGRVIQTEYSDGRKEAFEYRLDGELLKATNDVATVQFERNLIGGIIKEKVNDEWVTSTHDVLGNSLTTTSSLGAFIQNYYDGQGDLIQMDSQGWMATFQKDKLGLETSRSLPGGVRNQWQRDGIGRPIIQTVSQTTGSNTKVHRRKKYQWEFNNRLSQIQDERGITTFQHDAWSNLAKTTFPDGEIQFRIPDAVGNLFQAIDRKDRTYVKGGQLITDRGSRFYYDQEGNLITKTNLGGDVWQYKWNDAGLLVEVIRPDGLSVLFTYDALGRRLSKQFKNTITKFLWHGNIPLHEWKEHTKTNVFQSQAQTFENKANDTSAKNLGIVTTWLFDNESFSPCGKLKGDKQYSILTDYLGTPTQMYKADGTLLWECELDTYGKVRIVKGDLGSCPFRYQGQYEDVETGLYYNRFRYYSPEQGTYICQDPIKLSGGILFYGYVHDPLTWSDPLGLSPQSYSGAKGVKQAEKDLKANGFNIVAREVTLNTGKKGNIRIDILAEKNGKLYAFEVKNGASGYTANQTASGMFDKSKLANSSPSGGGTIKTGSGNVSNPTIETGNSTKLSDVGSTSQVGNPGLSKGDNLGNTEFNTLWYDK